MPYSSGGFLCKAQRSDPSRPEGILGASRRETARRGGALTALEETDRPSSPLCYYTLWQLLWPVFYACRAAHRAWRLYSCTSPQTYKGEPPLNF